MVIERNRINLSRDLLKNVEEILKVDLYEYNTERQIYLSQTITGFKTFKSVNVANTTNKV